MNIRKQLIYTAMLTGCLTLAACGGGGGSSSGSSGNGNGGSAGGNSGGNSGTGGGSAGNTQRLLRSTADYDNNGIADAVETFSYDANGRLVEIRNVYTDDGTPDIINLNEEGASEVTFTFTYNAQGRMAGWIKEIVFIDPTSIGPGRVARQEFTAAYDSNGFATEGIIEGFSIAGGQLFSQRFEPTYSGNRIASYVGFVNNLQSFTSTFTYGANGLPEQSVADFPSVEVAPGVFSDAFTTTYDFQWDANNRNTLAVFSTQDVANPGTNLTMSVESIYNASGQQVTQHWTASPITSPDIWSLNSTLSFTYNNQTLAQVAWDFNRDGSTDATVTLEWQSGSCIPAYFWLPQSLLPNVLLGQVPNNAHPSFIPGTGFEDIEHCSS